MPFQYPNHLGLTSLLPITKINSMFISTYVKITRIIINLSSFYTKTYGIELLCTWTKSRSFYTKT